MRDLKKLFELAEGYGIREWLQFDASVVRGLSYYTGIVFEGFDKSGELRAICGGGRYDALLESMGGEAMPAVGFGFGDAVIVELLKMKNLLPDTAQGSVQVVVFPMVEELRGQAVAAATALRSAGISVDVVLESKKPKWVFQRADKIGAGNAFFPMSVVPVYSLEDDLDAAPITFPSFHIICAVLRRGCGDVRT